MVLQPMQEEEAYGARVNAACSREGGAWVAVDGMPERECKGRKEDEINWAEVAGAAVFWMCFWGVVVWWTINHQ